MIYVVNRIGVLAVKSVIPILWRLTGVKNSDDFNALAIYEIMNTTRKTFCVDNSYASFVFKLAYSRIVGNRL